MTEEIQARIFDPFVTTKFAAGDWGSPPYRARPKFPFRDSVAVRRRPAGDTKDIPASATTADAGSIAGTVLIVEDEAALRLASKVLQKRGFSVVEAGDSRTAVDLFRVHEREIDVVLLDKTLPGMSGREVSAELRRRAVRCEGDSYDCIQPGKCAQHNR
jgi:hypothetical protein